MTKTLGRLSAEREAMMREDASNSRHLSMSDWVLALGVELDALRSERDKWKAKAENLDKFIRAAIGGIDWDEQFASTYQIGEDGADCLLAAVKFDWNLGIANDSIEKFLKEQE